MHAMMTAAVRIAAAASVALIAAVGPALAESATKAGSLTISKPWTRATPPGSKVAGAFMTITNTGSAPDRLVGGTSPVAGHVEIHEMVMDGNVMKMRGLGNGLEIKPGETVELKPGGYHVMLLDLRNPLTEGTPVAGTLKFEKAGEIAVTYDVAPIGARAQGGGASNADPDMKAHGHGHH
ncbi:MAG: copper chaperone PCu(A)C [Hyphomicrobiaceae bacterium]